MCKKLYVGVDSSTTNTGVVIIDEEKNLIEYKLFSPNKAKKIDDRVVEILKGMITLFDEYREYELIVSIEGAALYGKGKRSELSMLIGAIFYFLRVRDIEVQLVPPTTLKKYATGNGRADKSDMAKAAPKTISATFERHTKKFDDLIDAYFLATYSIK